MPNTPLAGIPYADGTTPVADWDDVLQAALLAVEKKLVLTFSTSTARDSAITSPVAGMLVYLTTPKSLTLYDGSAWVLLFAQGAYTPTLAAAAVGGGTGGVNTASYSWQNGWLDVEGSIRLSSSGASVSSSIGVSLPSGFTIADTANTITGRKVGDAYFIDGGTPDSGGLVRINDASSVLIMAWAVSGAKLVRTGLSSTVPFAWASTDEIKYSFRLRAVPT